MNSKTNFQRSEILQVKNLGVTLRPGFRDKVFAVRDVSLILRKGESLGIAGETGCGKSITAMAIMKLIPPPPADFKGEVIFKGKEILRLPEKEMRKIRGKEIAIIFQEASQALNPVFSIRYQITEAIRLHRNMSRSESENYAREILSEVLIPDPDRVLNAYPHELSGGMKQRVVIAIALSCAPSLLIADEPTTALDVTVQAQIIELLNSLREKKNLSTVIISHDLGVLNELVDRFLIMYAGYVVEEGTRADVIENPLHPYTKALLNALPVRGKIESIPGNLPDATEEINRCPFYERCNFRMERCNEIPPLFHLDSRRVRCFLYG